MSAARTTSTAALTALHTRYLFLETVRIPIAVLSTMMFPALSLLFFVVPQSVIADDPVAATGAAAQLSLFAVLSVVLFTFGAGVAEDRQTPWEPYVRTLPVGAVPRIAGRLLNGVAFALLGVLPVVVLAAVATAATLSPLRAVLGTLALVAGAIPFLGLGLAIGYGLPSKAAVPVAQLVLFPMAFAGGLFLPPELFPGWLDAVSRTLPSRASRDLVVGAVNGTPVGATTVLVLVVWGVTAITAAGWAYQRDEGRRFR